MSGRFARNSLFSTMAGLATALGSLLSMLLVARLLGTTGTGQVAYILWLVTLAVTFADCGIYQSLLRYLPAVSAERNSDAAVALGSWLLRPGLLVVLLGFAGFAVWALAVPEGGMFTPQGRWLIGLLFALQLFASFGLGMLRGIQRFDIAARLVVASLGLQLAGVTIGAIWAGVDGALLGYAAGQILPLAAAARALRRRAAVDRVLRARVVRFALFSWVGSLMMLLVWSRLEIMFLQHYQGIEAVALYTAGLTFSNLASQGPLLLTGALLPHFAESHARQAADQLRENYATATRIMALLLLPICFGLAAILPVVLPLAYGPAFVGAVQAGEILVAGAAIGASGAVGSQMIYARERSDFIFVSSLIGACLSVAACYLVIPRFGLVGAAWARLMVHGFMVTCGCWFIWRRLGCPVPLGALAKMAGSALLSANVARLCVSLIERPDVAIITAIAAGGLVYVAAIRASGAVPQQDVDRLVGFAARLPRRLRPPVTGALSLLASTRV